MCLYIQIFTYTTSAIISIFIYSFLKQPDLFFSCNKKRPGTGSMHEDPTQLATTSAARWKPPFFLIYICVYRVGWVVWKLIWQFLLIMYILSIVMIHVSTILDIHEIFAKRKPSFDNVSNSGRPSVGCPRRSHHRRHVQLLLTAAAAKGATLHDEVLDAEGLQREMTSCDSCI